MRNRHLVGLVLSLGLVVPVHAEDPEAAGHAAEAAGQIDQAFQQYMTALRALPDPPPSGTDLRLRERIITLVLKARMPLPVPPEAEQHLQKGRSLLDAYRLLEAGSSTQGFELVEAELRKAVRIAPWWPDAALALAEVQLNLKRYEEAAENLRLARLAPPTAKATAPPTQPAAIPAATTATVYVYWPKGVAQGINGDKLNCDDATIAKLQADRHLVLNLQSGSHTLRFGRDLELQFASGQTYYVRVFGHWNTWVPNHLEVVSEERARADMARNYSVPVSPDRVFDTECRGAAGSLGR